MPTLLQASPKISVWLFKTIDRQTIDGDSAVSTRYAGKDEYINLTPFLGEGSSVKTSKSVREPAGGFSITFMDQAQKDWVSRFSPPGAQSLETVYGLIEPMDVIEIRMWSGVGGGSFDEKYPIIMRGFVSEVQRQQTLGQDGKPQRAVVISGQDFGKIWQTFQVLFLPAYAEGKALLTSFAIAELFDFKAVAALPAGEFVRTMVEKIINPHIKGFLPDSLPQSIPKEIQTGDSISVKHGTVGQSFQSQTGSVYEIMRMHADVGVWNELYTEDREDGVHCVYRAIPALHLTAPEGGERKIQDDAPDPIYCDVWAEHIESVAVSRTDANIANFYWVNNAKYDLIDDMTRKLFGLTDGNKSISTKEYPNTAIKYYGVRPMYAETQMSGDDIKNDQSGQPQDKQDDRNKKQESWIEKRRRLMIEMNKDNVVFERGSMRIKGGLMRPGGAEAMKAGDYIRVHMGRLVWDAYVVQIDHDFVPYQGYTTTLIFERGEGFARRTALNGAPWIAEQASSPPGQI